MHPASPSPVLNPSTSSSTFLPSHPLPHSSPLSSYSHPQLPPLPSFRALPPHLPAFKPRSYCPTPSSATLSTLSSTSTVSSRSALPIPSATLHRPAPTPCVMPRSQSNPTAPPRRRGGRRTAPNSNLQCPTCLQYYSRRDNLRAHQRVHTGERPFSCRYCAQPFRWQGALRNHEGIHIRNGDPLPSDSTTSRQHRPSPSSSSSSSNNNNNNNSNSNSNSNNNNNSNATGTSAVGSNRHRRSTTRRSAPNGSTARGASNNSSTNNNHHNYSASFGNGVAPSPLSLMPLPHSAPASAPASQQQQQQQQQLFAQMYHAPYFHTGGAASNAPLSSPISSGAEPTDIAPFDAHHESRASVVVTGVESDFPRLDWGGAVLDDLTPRSDRSRE